MRFVILGAGAVGGVIGGRLAEHGHEVVLVARGAHLHALRRHGLRLVDDRGTTTVAAPAVGHPGEVDWRPGDVAVLSVKSQDSEVALAALSGSAPTGVPVVCAQNGVANERAALRRFPHVHAMCVMCPTIHLEPGVVEVRRAPVTGTLDLGRYPAGTDAVDEGVAAALAASGFLSEARPDIMRWKYAKLVLNLGNAVQALCGTGPEITDLAGQAGAEGREVLAAIGIDVTPPDEEAARRHQMGPNRRPPDVARAGGSSWQSLRRGSPTIETDHLNGEIVLLGRLHGIPTPVNAVLQHLAAVTARSGGGAGSWTIGEVQGLVDEARTATAATAPVP